MASGKLGGPARLQGDQTKPKPISVWIENKLTVFEKKTRMSTGKRERERSPKSMTIS